MPAPRSDAWLSVAAFVILGLPTGGLGVAWLRMRLDLHASLAGLGLILAISTVASFSSVATGRLSSWLGLRRLFAIGALAGGMGVLGLGLAPSWPTALLAAAVWGAATGPFDAVVNARVAGSGSVRVMGWIHAAWGLGAAAGPLAVLLAVEAGSWRWSYIGMGLAFFTLAGIAVVGGWGDEPHPMPIADRPSAATLTPLMIALAASVFAVYVGLEWSTGQWAFTSLTLARGLRSGTAGGLVSLYWIALTAGRALLGVFGSPAPRAWLLTTGMSLALVGSLGFWLAPGLVAAACLPLIGLGLSIIVPLLYLSSGAVGSETARLVGYQAGGGTAGGAALPAAVGVLMQSAGPGALGPALVALAVLQGGLHLLSLRRVSAGRSPVVNAPTPARR